MLTTAEVSVTLNSHMATQAISNVHSCRWQCRSYVVLSLWL